MDYNISYCIDYKRIMAAVLIDSRGTIPLIANTDGYATKAYCDAQIDLVGEKSLVYIIETDNSNLVGYFILQVNSTAESAILIQKQFRPAFQQFSTIISQKISNFITSNEWQDDFIF